jgi:DnaJ-domain-containing protein 1
VSRVQIPSLAPVFPNLSIGAGISLAACVGDHRSLTRKPNNNGDCHRSADPVKDQANKLPRDRLEAQVQLADGKEVIMTFFTAPHQRLSDLLNEPRNFLPVETADGRMSILAKSAIRWAAPLEQAQISSADPFSVLGLRDTASDDEVRATYQRLLADFDATRLRALNLAPPYLEFANTQRARLTDALHRIAQQRGFYRDVAA